MVKNISRYILIKQNYYLFLMLPDVQERAKCEHEIYTIIDYKYLILSYPIYSILNMLIMHWQKQYILVF